MNLRGIDINRNEWPIHLNGKWRYPKWMSEELFFGLRENSIWVHNNKVHCILNNNNNNMNSDNSATITSITPALQHRLGSSSWDVKLAKHFVHEKLCKKVQFLQMSNDELMKKVFNQARKFMKYDSDTFMNVWFKTVLPAIKSEMNILRSGYALAMKNWLIQGKCNVPCIACTAMVFTYQLLAVCLAVWMQCW